MYEAGTEEYASWETVGTALGVSAEQARADYLAVIERMERGRVGDPESYRRAL